MTAPSMPIKAPHGIQFDLVENVAGIVYDATHGVQTYDDVNGTVNLAETVAALGVFPDDISGAITIAEELDTFVVRSGAAAASGTGVTAAETSAIKTLTLTLVNTPIPLTDEAGVVAYGGLKVADLPAGNILFLGAVADLAVTKSSAGVNDDWDGDIGLGTVTASNNATLTGTEQDLIPSTATPQAVAGATTGDCYSTSTEAPKVFDGTSAAVDVYLNVLVDDGDQDVTGTPCNLIFNGTIKLSYLNLGDV